jgi:hypothetical protein
MATVDLLCSTLLTLIEVTQQLYAAVEDENYETLNELFDKRDHLLEQQSFLLVRWKDSSKSADNKGRDLSRLKPLLDLLQQWDRKLSALVIQKRDEVAQYLRQASNQKRLLAYTR